MEAESILLTHFSQRYPKIPILRPAATNQPTTGGPSRGEAAAVEPEPVVALAFDCASIPIGSMWKMSRYKPALERLFTELAEEPGADDEEAVLRAAALGVAVPPAVAQAASALPPSTASSSKSAAESSRARAEGDDLSSTQPAKKRKLSATKKQAVG